MSLSLPTSVGPTKLATYFFPSSLSSRTHSQLLAAAATCTSCPDTGRSHTSSPPVVLLLLLVHPPSMATAALKCQWIPSSPVLSAWSQTRRGHGRPHNVGTTVLPGGSTLSLSSVDHLLVTPTPATPSPMLPTTPISSLGSRRAAPAPMAAVSTPLHPFPMVPGLWQLPPPSANFASRGKLSMVEFFDGNKEEDDMWVLNVIDC